MTFSAAQLASRDLVLKLSMFFLLGAVLTIISKACPDIVEYANHGLLQDMCHLATFTVGVFVCHLAVAPVQVGGRQPTETSAKIRIPLYLL
mmetsp:Transcript_145739/g.406058  ORF Transcript_145739/g.406058 Transcript_145739/m.406058 type:complete len:91 (+) Transcript_145739:85-357(+)